MQYTAAITAVRTARLHRQHRGGADRRRGLGLPIIRAGIGSYLAPQREARKEEEREERRKRRKRKERKRREREGRKEEGVFDSSGETFFVSGN